MKFPPRPLAVRHALLSIACATALAACAANENPVDEGQPIPESGIVSCGDELIGLAAPTGALTGGTLVVSASETRLDATLMAQASCPKGESSAESEYSFEKLTVYRDDAGFPGEAIGSAPFTIKAKLSCTARSSTQIGGTTQEVPLGPPEVPSLMALCKERATMPNGSALYAHVELTGRAVTCSSTKTDLLIRSKVPVTCP